jgi:probable rRNA maturation factor
MNANPGIDIQCAISAEGLPSAAQLYQWLQLALQDRMADSELTLRIVDEAEITALNHRYRGKDGATNVLSFPYQPLPGVESGLLGDIVICAPVVAREAVAQSKSLEAHWAHITIHGVLHLLGHDHQQAEQAGDMERLEVKLLGQIGFADPYQPRVDS